MADRSVWTYVVTTDLEFFATVQPLWSSSLAAGAQPTPATRRCDSPPRPRDLRQSRASVAALTAAREDVLPSRC